MSLSTSTADGSLTYIYEVVRHISSPKKGNTGGNGRSTRRATSNRTTAALVLTPLDGKLVRFLVMD